MAKRNDNDSERRPARVPIAELPKPLVPPGPPPAAPAGATPYRVTLRHSPLHVSCKSVVLPLADPAGAKEAFLRHVEATLSDTDEHKKNLDDFRVWCRTPEGAAALAALEVQPAAVAEQAKAAAQATIEAGVKGTHAKEALSQMAQAR